MREGTQQFFILAFGKHCHKPLYFKAAKLAYFFVNAFDFIDIETALALLSADIHLQKDIRSHPCSFASARQLISKVKSVNRMVQIDFAD